MTKLAKDAHILVIIGPSGTGKSSIVQALAKEGLVEVTPTWTTRPPRPAEPEQAIEHKFVSDATFGKAEKNGEFLETIALFGLPFRYGMPSLKLTKPNVVPVVMLRAPLLAIFKKYYSNFTTYQIEDSLENIKQRLTERQQHGEPIGSRLNDFEKEIAIGRQLADRVFINTQLAIVINEVRNALAQDFNH